MAFSWNLRKVFRILNKNGDSSYEDLDMDLSTSFTDMAAPVLDYCPKHGPYMTDDDHEMGGCVGCYNEQQGIHSGPIPETLKLEKFIEMTFNNYENEASPETSGLPQNEAGAFPSQRDILSLADILIQETATMTSATSIVHEPDPKI